MKGESALFLREHLQVRPSIHPSAWPSMHLLVCKSRAWRVSPQRSSAEHASQRHHLAHHLSHLPGHALDSPLESPLESSPWARS